MNTPILVSGFTVKYKGDPSVGIFDQNWDISGDFEFELPEDLELFKSKIKEAFEYCSDTPIGVYSYEEIREAYQYNEEINGGEDSRSNAK